MCLRFKFSTHQRVCALNFLLKKSQLLYPIIITSAKLTFMHTVYYGYAPPSFSNTWQTQAQRNPDLNLRNATDIYVPFPRIDLFKRMPIYALPHTWNSHDIVRYYANRTTFRYALQELLHSEAEMATE